jgi:hypothetical protein
MSALMLEPEPAAALRTCRAALRRIADYFLDPAIDRRLLDLGERKDELDPNEHAELLALVAFSQQRSIDKFEAALAIKRLESAYPELMSDP